MIPRDDVWPACAGQNDIMFDAGPGGRYVKAREVCAACALRADCLRVALEEEGDTPARYRFGVRGGLIPAQRARLTAPRTFICEVCKAEKVSHRNSKTCGPACHQLRVALYMRDYQRTYRNSGRVNPIPKGNRHGSISMAHSGCRCAPCRNRRRTERRLARVRAKKREAA